VHEHVLRAVRRRNKPISLGGVEKLDGTGRHEQSPRNRSGARRERYFESPPDTPCWRHERLRHGCGETRASEYAGPNFETQRVPAGLIIATVRIPCARCSVRTGPRSAPVRYHYRLPSGCPQAHLSSHG
jgi:hypothetical protein